MKNIFFFILLLAGLLVLPNLLEAQPTNPPVVASNAAPVSTTDWNSFRGIYQHNIFDPNRSPRRTNAPAPYVRPRRTDSFTLVGTLSYEKGTFAFFDGSSSEYRKTLKTSDKIAGYRITRIATDYISLAGVSNDIPLRVGQQMKRQENGPWTRVSQPDSEPSDSISSSDTPPAAASSAAPAPPAGESDVMKRLMAKRLSEQ